MPLYNVRVTIAAEHCFTIETATKEEARQVGEDHAWLESRGEEALTPEEIAYLNRHEHQVTYVSREETHERTVVETAPNFSRRAVYKQCAYVRRASEGTPRWSNT